ncbi:hypothetical protein M413DRAFT_348846 [Hebeloma cylindrosporum]|uniref:WW domain-containing protein n=1 Tax=Hebeloma cylindrosporum TaxID=76867 RepID=A0A0C3BFA8_HEBCY|nr:hypothetical protein M413DRAFT_348846 [Hebeloma cylindrosporum h7]
MFRLTALLQRPPFKRLYSSPPPTSAQSPKPKPTHFIPEDWYIIETNSGGREKEFVNRKTRELTWYTPEGMTAEEILAVPGAKKYWSTTAKVEKYIKEMAAEKAKYGGRDWKDAIRDAKG